MPRSFGRLLAGGLALAAVLGPGCSLERAGTAAGQRGDAGIGGAVAGGASGEGTGGASGPGEGGAAGEGGSAHGGEGATSGASGAGGDATGGYGGEASGGVSGSGGEAGSGGETGGGGTSPGGAGGGGTSGSTGEGGGGQGGAGGLGVGGAAGQGGGGAPAGGKGGSAGSGGCVLHQDPCDLDCDGHLRVGPECKGDDCCDADPLVFAGQTAFFDVPDACQSFDYDCDGKETGEWGKGDACHICGFSCCSSDGFLNDPPACGDTAPKTGCSGGICNNTGDMLTQKCN